MAQNLAQNLVDLSSWGLGSDRTAELGLNHGEHRLHVRPLVVVLKKCSLIEVVVMPHTIPQAIELVMMVSYASRIDLERNVTRISHIKLHPQIGFLW